MASRDSKAWRGRALTGLGIGLVALVGVLAAVAPASAECGCWAHRHHLPCWHSQAYTMGPGDIVDCDNGGTWYWMRSPEQEQRIINMLYNRYCIRCHGIDGRGVWDIPDVPDFTNLCWQNSRPDDYRARVIMEGRGAVMPPFRGTLTLEEAWGLARYLHTMVPGAEISRPDLGNNLPAANAPPPPTVNPQPAQPEALRAPTPPPPSVASPFQR